MWKARRRSRVTRCHLLAEKLGVMTAWYFEIRRGKALFWWLLRPLRHTWDCMCQLLSAAARISYCRDWDISIAGTAVGWVTEQQK